MKREIEIVRHGVIVESEHILGNFNWPSIARMADGTLAMVCSGERYEHIDPFGKVVICYSKDEGKTWTCPATVIDTLLDDRDAGVVCWKDKLIVTSFNNSRAFQNRCLEIYNHSENRKNFFRSYMNYITDEYEAKHLGSMVVISKDAGYTFGEVHYAPVMSPHGMAVMNDGRLLYIGSPFLSPEEVKERKICYSISENGIDWSESKELFPDTGERDKNWMERKQSYFCEPHALCLPSGRILIGLREEVPEKHFNVWMAHSDDGMKTVSDPVKVTAGSPPHLFYHSTGVVILTYGFRNAPYGQRVRISEDDGTTFGEEIVLRNDGIDWDLGYPATAELADGSLISVYYQRTAKQKRNNSICYTVWKFR